MLNKKVHINFKNILFLLLTLFFIFVAIMSVIIFFQYNNSDNFNNKLYTNCYKFHNKPNDCIKYPNCQWNSQLNGYGTCTMSGEVPGSYGNSNVIN